MLRGKHIIIGITGGIAAYKIPQLVREVRRAGADVKVVMTGSASHFVTPLTLSTLSGAEVVTGMFPDQDDPAIDMGTWHISLGQWADVMIIAPATANTIAKLASGSSDNAVTALVLALRCPLIIAPAMDTDMWNHPATQSNIRRCSELGYVVLPPDTGELASGLFGPGRMPEIHDLILALDKVAATAPRDLKGKRVLVTAGPTYESIDPVRFIGNRSSGKMGFAIAAAAVRRGASVTLISGPSALPTPLHVRRIDVESSAQMHARVMEEYPSNDVLIMAAAVSDFSPSTVSSTKIKKESLNGKPMTLKLVKTRDILSSVGAQKRGKVLVGFALETDNELTHAKRKLKEKHLDMIVMNNPLTEGSGFGSDTNVVTILSKDGSTEPFPTMSKDGVASEILDRVARMVTKPGKRA